MSFCVTFSVPGQVEFPKRINAGYHEREHATQAYLQGWSAEAFCALTNRELVNNHLYTNAELRELADLIDAHWRIIIRRRALPTLNANWMHPRVRWMRAVIYWYLAMWRITTRAFADAGGTMYASW